MEEFFRALTASERRPKCTRDLHLARLRVRDWDTKPLRAGEKFEDATPKKLTISSMEAEFQTLSRDRITFQAGSRSDLEQRPMTNLLKANSLINQ
jgi:hypothetical protein